MPATYFLPNAHIDVLIDIAQHYGLTPGLSKRMRWHRNGVPTELSDRSYTDLGRILLAENATSVAYRYGEAIDPCALTYFYRPTHHTFTPAAALQAVACYEHQTAGHPGWLESEARNFCLALRETIVARAIPWRTSDPWCWNDTDLASARADAQPLSGSTK
jgi:hypothetical protein